MERATITARNRGVAESYNADKKNDKKPKFNPNIAVIQPPFQRVEKLDLFNRMEPKIRPLLAYWISDHLIPTRHKSVPGLHVLDICQRIFVAQNGIGNFLLYSGCDVVFKAREELGLSGKPDRKIMVLNDSTDEKVLQIERTGKQGQECNVICVQNKRLLGNILQVGVKKSTYILGNEQGTKICQIQKSSKRTYFQKNKDAGLIEYEFRTVHDEPVGGGITFIGTLGYFGKVGNPKTCAIRFPSTIGIAEKALFLAATFFFDFLEFKPASEAEIDCEGIQVVPFGQRFSRTKSHDKLV